MPSPYRISEIQENTELSTIFDMWNENLGITAEMAREKYNRYYKENPYQKGTILVLKHINNTGPVGAVGLVYRDFVIGGKKYTGRSLLDFVVDKEHRTLGPALMLLEQAVTWEDGVSDFLYSFPNHKSEIIIKRTACKCIGHLSRYAKVLNYAPYLEKKLGTNIVLNRLTSFLAFPLNLIVRLRAFVNQFKNSRGYFSKLTKLDEFLDKESLPTISDFEVLGDRSANFYSWRFDKKSQSNHLVFSIHQKESKNKTLSAVVFSIEKNTIEVIDILSNTTFIRETLALFEYEVSRQFKKDSISVHLTSNGPFTEYFLNTDYSLRDANTSPIFINTFNQKSLGNSFFNLESSLWMHADMDV